MMLKSTLGLLALTSSLAHATLTDEDGNLIRCDSDAPLPAEYFATHETYKRHPHSLDHWKRQDRTITVDTWIHVIARSDQSREDGWLSVSLFFFSLFPLPPVPSTHPLPKPIET